MTDAHSRRLLPVVRLVPEAALPSRAYDGDAGLDLHAITAVVLEPGARATVPTGLALAIPEGHAGLVLPRSGLAARHGITVVNAPGLVDAGYRGEVQVVLLNTDRFESFAVEPGMRIAQLVLVPFVTTDVVEAGDLPTSQRGAGGFGSSGGFVARSPFDSSGDA